MSHTWTVFTKPWPDDDATRLAARVAEMGFDGIELPVRDGFPVSSENVTRGLARWVRVFADVGLTIASVTGEITPTLFDACADAGVHVIRVMAPIVGDNAPHGSAGVRAALESCASLAESYGVRVAVQQHHGRYVSTSAGLRSLLEGLPLEAIGVAWDAGHSALAGEDVDLGFSETADRLIMLNLKNAYYERTDNGAGELQWQPRWVSGREGMSDWFSVSAAARAVEFNSTICLSAQYTDPHLGTQAQASADLKYAREVFA